MFSHLVAHSILTQSHSIYSLNGSLLLQFSFSQNGLQPCPANWRWLGLGARNGQGSWWGWSSSTGGRNREWKSAFDVSHVFLLESFDLRMGVPQESDRFPWLLLDYGLHHGLHIRFQYLPYSVLHSVWWIPGQTAVVQLRGQVKFPWFIQSSWNNRGVEWHGRLLPWAPLPTWKCLCYSLSFWYHKYDVYSRRRAIYISCAISPPLFLVTHCSAPWYTGRHPWNLAGVLWSA